MNRNPCLLFGFDFDPIRIDEVVDRCRTAIVSRNRMLLGVLNAAKVVKARKDPLLRESLMQCDMLLADGQSIVWASRILGRALPERVTGIDVFERLLMLGDRERRSVYLLGAREDVLEQLIGRLRKRFPGLRIVGSHNGYFDQDDSERIADEIRAAQPDMLFLGITSPKKEIFLGSFGASLDVPVMHGVGGSFDILAGVTRRAPETWQRLGMEWAFRIAQEPGRLWWRYFTTNTAFILLTLRELVRPSRAYRLLKTGSGWMADRGHSQP